jgi:hypothetical protein
MFSFMSNEAGEDPRDEQPPESEQQPPTPFDHPLFLPVLLLAGVVWFGYDGWLNQDPDMLEHRAFNRVGFVILTALAGWFGYRGVKDYQADKRAARSRDGSDRSA